MEAVQTVEHPDFEAIRAILRENAETQRKNAEAQRENAEAQRENTEAQRKNAEAQRKNAEAQRKNAEEWKKRHEEWEVRQKKSAEEWEVRQKKSAEEWEETKRQMKESAARLDQQMGKLGGRLGDMVEHMVAPNLVEKFGELGVVFEKEHLNTRIKDKKNDIFAQADITLENSEKVMIVEVKTKLTTEDITDHIKRMGKMRVYADKHGDKRKYLGAVAAMVMTDNEKDFAFKNGFYVLEPSGETFTIAVPEGSYSVKEW